MNSDIPAWVWLLLAHSEEYEEVHGTNERCINDALNTVPPEARAYGRAYIRGRAEALLEVKNGDNR